MVLSTKFLQFTNLVLIFILDLYTTRMMGCFADSAKRRDLPRLELYNPPGGLTQEMCVKTCFNKVRIIIFNCVQ